MAKRTTMPSSTTGAVNLLAPKGKKTTFAAPGDGSSSDEEGVLAGGLGGDDEDLAAISGSNSDDDDGDDSGSEEDSDDDDAPPEEASVATGREALLASERARDELESRCVAGPLCLAAQTVPSLSSSETDSPSIL